MAGGKVLHLLAMIVTGGQPLLVLTAGQLIALGHDGALLHLLTAGGFGLLPADGAHGAGQFWPLPGAGYPAAHQPRPLPLAFLGGARATEYVDIVLPSQHRHRLLITGRHTALNDECAHHGAIWCRGTGETPLLHHGGAQRCDRAAWLAGQDSVQAQHGGGGHLGRRRRANQDRLIAHHLGLVQLQLSGGTAGLA